MRKIQRKTTLRYYLLFIVKAIWKKKTSTGMDFEKLRMYSGTVSMDHSIEGPQKIEK